MTRTAARPYRYLHSDGKVRRHPELPRRVRLRLAARRRLTIVGVWLLDHGCERATVWIWRVCGMWPKGTRLRT